MQIKQNFTINFWDDFYDDGFVPEGEEQKTFAYVEENLDLKAQAFLISWLKLSLEPLLPKSNLAIVFFDSKKEYPNVPDRHFKRWHLEIKNITHKDLENLLEKISELTHPEYNITFSSDS